MRRASTVLLVVVLVAGAAAGWLVWRHAMAAPVQSAACRGSNLLFITIDTLRADRVGAFGGPAGLTPNLDRLAAEGARLTRAYSSVPLTLPSHASIFTSVSPPVHGVRANGLFRLGPSLPTLATVLHDAGYRTGAFVGAFVLDARFGLNRGFDSYDDRYGEKHAGDDTEGAERRAEEVVEPALAWIAQPATRAGQPWFAWLHLYDPHEPYRAPQPWASEHAPYDAEVAYTDAMVGRLLDTLRAAGQLDRTLVIVTADHGESLGDHGERTHGVFAYDATLRVPALLWAGPRIGGRAVDGTSRLIDLAPTALDLLGVAAPSTFEGVSLLPLTGAGGRTLYFEAMDANLTRGWAPLTGTLTGGYKLIDLPTPELYALAGDPGETANLYPREGARARTLESLLRSAIGGFATRATTPSHTALDADARQRLQALGYVASSVEPGQRTYTSEDDPKNLIGVSNELNDALGAFNRGDRPAAMTAVRRIAQAHPRFSTAWGSYGAMQHDVGDLPGAIATLEELVGRRQADQSVMVVLAGYLAEAGRPEKSAALLEAVIAAHPDYAEAYNSLGVVWSRLGRRDAAHAAYRKVLELDPTSARAYENLGVDEVAAGDSTAAVADLTRALDLDPNLAGAHNALAAALARQRRLDEAVAHWKTAIGLDRRLYDALYNLGISLWDAGRHDEARPWLERFVAVAPPRYAGDVANLRRLLAK